MDVIEDTCLAIEAFTNLSSSQHDTGLVYLAVYGLLQSLYVQQDAISNLCAALDFSFNKHDNSVLKGIRNIRNESIGHPTDRTKGSDHSFHGISRTTLSTAGFQLLSQDSQGKTKFEDIELVKLMEQQESILNDVLGKVAMEIQERDNRHKERFMAETLRSVFPRNFNYELGKLMESTYTDDLLGFGNAMISEVKKVMDDLKNALSRRDLGIDSYPGVEGVYEELRYPVARLEVYFRDGVFSAESPEDSKRACYIFARFIREKMLELVQIAGEIDEEYSS